MAPKIVELIDKQDTAEIVRDQIASILYVEKEEQKVLAAAAAKDPALWDFDVYVERSRPWEILTNTDGSEGGDMPLVNVSFDSDAHDNKGGNVVASQKVVGTFNVDCYGQKTKRPTAPGNEPATNSGDEQSSKEADRIARLVRNILMADVYTYLALSDRELGLGNGLVISRYVMRREKFQPDIQAVGFENIVAERVTVRVEYTEFSPQLEGVDLEVTFSEVQQDDTGKVIGEVQTDNTAP